MTELSPKLKALIPKGRSPDWSKAPAAQGDDPPPPNGLGDYGTDEGKAKTVNADAIKLTFSAILGRQLQNHGLSRM
jgi:hypothetical protein